MQLKMLMIKDNNNNTIKMIKIAQMIINISKQENTHKRCEFKYYFYTKHM